MLLERLTTDHAGEKHKRSLNVAVELLKMYVNDCGWSYGQAVGLLNKNERDAVRQEEEIYKKMPGSYPAKEEA